MIKKDAQPIVSDKAQEIEKLLRSLVSYREKVSRKYQDAKRERDDASDALMEKVKVGRFKRKEPDYIAASERLDEKRAALDVEEKKLKAAKESIRLTMAAYVAEMVRANADTLIGECSRYKRTKGFVRRMAPTCGDFSCYIAGAEGYFPSPYINVYSSVDGCYRSIDCDIYLAHDGDIIGKDGEALPACKYQPGPTPDAIESAASRLEEARAIAKAAREAYSHEMDRVTGMLSALGRETIEAVKEGR